MGKPFFVYLLICADAWCEETQSRDEAKELELQIKRWSRAKKAALIRGDFAAIRQAAKKRFSSSEQQ